MSADVSVVWYVCPVWKADRTFMVLLCIDTFLELLEPYILKDMLGGLAPEVCIFTSILLLILVLAFR